MSKLALLGNKEQSKQFDINGDRLMIGRNPDNDIRLNNVTVSRYHAMLVSTMGNTYVEDLNSKNGTLIVSKRIEKHRMWEDGAWQAYNEINVNTKHVKKCLLKDGDIIKICNYKFRFIKDIQRHNDTEKIEIPRLSDLTSRPFKALNKAVEPLQRSGIHWGWLSLLLLLFPLFGITAYTLHSEGRPDVELIPRVQSADITDAVETVLAASLSRRSATSLVSAPMSSRSQVKEPVEQALFTEALDSPRSPGDYLALLDEPDVSLAGLFDLSVKTIVIDPGHGGRDPGATGSAGLHEKEITLALARDLRNRLNKHDGYRVLLTRRGDEYLSLKERVEFANQNGADLFISIHINAYPVEKPPVVETYYFGPHKDHDALRVAEAENRGSDYGMGEFRQMINKLGESFKHQESLKLAASVQRNLYWNIKRENKAVKSGGVRTAPFVVLLGVDAPGILAEVTTLSNRREEQKLKTARYREQMAEYLEAGIVEYLNLTREQSGPVTRVNDDGKNANKVNNASEKGRARWR